MALARVGGVHGGLATRRDGRGGNFCLFFSAFNTPRTRKKIGSARRAGESVGVFGGAATSRDSVLLRTHRSSPTLTTRPPTPTAPHRRPPRVPRRPRRPRRRPRAVRRARVALRLSLPREHRPRRSTRSPPIGPGPASPASVSVLVPPASTPSPTPFVTTGWSPPGPVAVVAAPRRRPHE